MAHSISTITSITADYDAIESAIRETSRGRWFLNCFLERNRSAETKMLLGAIAKLEAAMRDNGLAVASSANRVLLEELRNSIDEARCDLAGMPDISEPGPFARDAQAVDFEGIPASGVENLQIIRDAAESIHSAAFALQSAGVFQGVAEQIAENASMIEHSCMAQEGTLLRASRMAALLSEIEAELIAAADEGDVLGGICQTSGTRPEIPVSEEETDLPEEIVEHLSAAIAECFEDGDINGSQGR